MKKSCLAIFHYATEVRPRNKAHINSLDFALISCFSKIFYVKSRETTASECMQLFNCQCVKHVADKRRHIFIHKYSASRNGICRLFIYVSALIFCQRVENAVTDWFIFSS